LVPVYVAPAGDDDEVFCSVKDNGSGFEHDAVTEGVGLTRSIRERVTAVGGSAEIDGRPGLGAEVRISLPVRGSP
jgi:signal transduction histidine kinase